MPTAWFLADCRVSIQTDGPKEGQCRDGVWKRNGWRPSSNQTLGPARGSHISASKCCYNNMLVDRPIRHTPCFNAWSKAEP